MGISCKPMGRMKSDFRKMDHKAFAERQKMVKEKATKPTKKEK